MKVYIASWIGLSLFALLLLPNTAFASVCIGLSETDAAPTCLEEPTETTDDIAVWCPVSVGDAGLTDPQVEEDDTCALWQQRQEDAARPVSEPLPATLLTNPLGDGHVNIALIVGRAIQFVMGTLGAITLLVFVSGAGTWITSAGYPQRVQQGIRTMLFAVAGLFVIFSAYGILNTFIRALTTGNL